MYERILVPLDGSAAAEAALAFAELIPSRRVRLLSVEPDDQGPMLAGVDELAAWRAAREAEIRVGLERAAETLRRQGRDVEIAVAFGDPAERINAAAADADLIAMTTHGRGAGGRSLFGSVADRVARHAPTATLIVRGGPRPTTPPPVTRLVVPLDGSARAETALPVAERLAADLGLPIHLVRVVEPPGPTRPRFSAAPVPPTNGDPSTADAARYLARLSQRLRNRDQPATTEILSGTPAPALLDAIRVGDLAVLSTRGYGGLRRWLLGSVADKLVRAANAPVLLVRDPSERAANTLSSAGSAPDR